jgi:hypothetical protein
MKRLSAEPGCQNNTLWRYELPAPIALEAFVGALTEHAWRDQSKPHAPLFMLTHEDEEHRMILVKVTRRVQLRLFYLTQREDRVACAERLGASFDAICEELLSEQT